MGDGLPILLCLTCEDKLNSAFEFKQQCENTDVALRELKDKLTCNNSVKEESLDIVVQPDLEIYGDANDQYYDSDSDDDKPLKARASDSYTCTYCHKELRTKKGLKIHQRKHTGENLHICQVCNTKFTKRNHLARHMKVHGKKDETKYACDQCDEKFCSNYLLTKHKNEHAEELKGENSDEKMEDSETVGESNGVEENLDEQLKLKACFNPESGLYECGFCKKLLSTLLGLRIHMRRHTGDNLAKCEVSTR